MKEEFSNLNIDTSIREDQNQKHEPNTSISAETADRILHPTTFDPANLQKLKITELDEINEEETEVIQLKDNFLPTGLAPLEDIFYSNDLPKKPKMQPINAEIEECNIGTIENPKMIKLSRTLPPDKKS